MNLERSCMLPAEIKITFFRRVQTYLPLSTIVSYTMADAILLVSGQTQLWLGGSSNFWVCCNASFEGTAPYTD